MTSTTIDPNDGDEITFLPHVPYAVRLRYQRSNESPRALGFVQFWLCRTVAGPDGKRQLRCKPGTRGEPFGVDDPSEAQIDASGSVKFDGCVNLDAREAHTCDGMSGFGAFTAALTAAVRICDALFEGGEGD